MSGTEQAKTKENVAAIMRAKQLAGTFVFFCISLAVMRERRSCCAGTERVLCPVGGADKSRSRSEEGRRGRQKIDARSVSKARPSAFAVRAIPQSTANRSGRHRNGVLSGCNSCDMVFMEVFGYTTFLINKFAVSHL